MKWSFPKMVWRINVPLRSFGLRFRMDATALSTYATRDISTTSSGSKIPWKKNMVIRLLGLSIVRHLCYRTVFGWIWSHSGSSADGWRSLYKRDIIHLRIGESNWMGTNRNAQGPCTSSLVFGLHTTIRHTLLIFFTVTLRSTGTPYLKTQRKIGIQGILSRSTHETFSKST